MAPVVTTAQVFKTFGKLCSFLVSLLYPLVSLVIAVLVLLKPEQTPD